MNLFASLINIQNFNFKAKANEKSSTNWNGSGQGNVITKLVGNRIYFKEEGAFKLDNHLRETKIFNEYIWTQLSESKLRLSHSRFGYNNEIILFELEQINGFDWVSTKPHICGKDSYSAEILHTSKNIELNWKITGPKKDEFIKYVYSTRTTT